VDYALTTLCRHLGRCVQRDILREKRVEYVEQIVSALRSQLELEFGRGYGEKIVATLRRQLSWTDALPKKELERKLHEAVRLARARLEVIRD